MNVNIFYVHKNYTIYIQETIICFVLTSFEYIAVLYAQFSINAIFCIVYAIYLHIFFNLKDNTENRVS